MEEIEFIRFSFENCRQMTIQNQKSLKTVKVGMDCFRSFPEGTPNYYDEYNERNVFIEDKQFCEDELYTYLQMGSYGYTDYKEKVNNDEDGVCTIKDCLELKTIEVKDRSFFDYHICNMDNLPQLTTISIGSECFQYIHSFTLKGIV